MHLAKVIPRCVGCILLTSACMKGYSLISESFIRIGSVEIPQLLGVVVVMIEMQLGILVFVGLAWRWLLWTILCLFIIFTAISSIMIASGATTCGCFGAVSISPLVTFSLDIIIIACIAFALRFRERDEDRIKLRQQLKIFAICALIPAVAGFTLWQRSRSSEVHLKLQLLNSSGDVSIPQLLGLRLYIAYRPGCPACKSVMATWIETAQLDMETSGRPWALLNLSDNEDASFAGSGLPVYRSPLPQMASPQILVTRDEVLLENYSSMDDFFLASRIINNRLQ